MNQTSSAEDLISIVSFQSIDSGIEPSQLTFYDLPTELVERIFLNLDLLTIIRLRQVSSDCQRVVNSYFSSLKEVNVSQITSCEKVKRETVESFFANPITNWFSLRKLNFDGQRKAFEPLTMSIFAAIFRNCPNLNSLVVDAEVINDGWNVKDFDKSGRLRTFRWYRRSRFGKTFERLVCNACPLLTVAQMHTLPSVVMVALKQLILDHWPTYAERSLKFLWSRLPCLESLVVYWGRRANAVRHMSALATQCLKLVEFCSIASDLEDIDLLLLPPNRLKRIELFYNYHLTDHGICKLASRQNGLISIGLNYLFELSGESIVALIENCYGLQQLAVCGCPKISNLDLEKIALLRMTLLRQISLPVLTIYAHKTSIDVPKCLKLTPDLLTRAKLIVVTDLDPSKPIMLVPIR